MLPNWISFPIGCYIHVPAEGNPSLALNKALGQPLGKIWAQAPANMIKEPWPHMAYEKEIKDQEVARIELISSPMRIPISARRLFTS